MPFSQKGNFLRKEKAVVLQCVTVCCSELQCDAVCCRVTELCTLSSIYVYVKSCVHVCACV